VEAGVAQIDITPPCGLPHGSWRLRAGLAEGIHDPLLATAAVLDDGETRIAVIGVDLVNVERSFCARVREAIEALTGIPPANVLINAAHNHSAPKLFTGVQDLRDTRRPQGFGAFETVLVQALAGAVYAAGRSSRPARIGLSRVRVPDVSVNRIRPERAIDDWLTMLDIEATDGSPIAMIVRFSCHGVCMAGQTLLWNADFVGPMREKLQEERKPARCLFLQGCAGNIAPWDYWFGNERARAHTYENRDRLGYALADAALASLPEHHEQNTRLRARSQTVELERRQLPWSLEEIQAFIERLGPEDSAALPAVWPDDMHTATSAQRSPESYQRARLALYAGMKACEQQPMPTELQALGIGDAALVGASFELFNELGEEIAAGAPFEVTLPLGYSNGYQGYLPTTADLDSLPPDVPLEQILDQDKYRTAYGITTTAVGRGSADLVVERARALIGSLAGSPARAGVRVPARPVPGLSRR
jgi:neutral ceramidase